MVSVGGVEYKVESVPFKETIPLLRNGPFDNEMRLRSSVGPLDIRNRTARALKDVVESETQKAEAAFAPTKLSVGSTFGGERSVTTSRVAVIGRLKSGERKKRLCVLSNHAGNDNLSTSSTNSVTITSEEPRQPPCPAVITGFMRSIRLRLIEGRSCTLVIDKTGNDLSRGSDHPNSNGHARPRTHGRLTALAGRCTLLPFKRAVEKKAPHEPWGTQLTLSPLITNGRRPSASRLLVVRRHVQRGSPHRDFAVGTDG